MEARENNFKSIVTNENRLDIPCEYSLLHSIQGESLANRIINEVAGINRVVKKSTSKPLGTIESE